MPKPQRQDIEQYRGDTCGVLLRLWEDDAKTEPVDLSGVVVTAQVRVKATDAEALTDFAVATATNEVTLTLTPTQTRELPTQSVWDCQLDWLGDGASIQTIVSGTIKVTQDVTR